ncbi:MAG: carboxy-S-adenosyl-L-methionine synthase CmoA [Proteobacteria bacterium]|nr:carboxy-S-adenosyl-L-methionine synthase CmoA [Pseudomonadota bacterium]
MKDTLFKSDKINGKFKFDEKVAGVFDDMLSRSVPFYSEVQQMVADLAGKYYIEGSKVYDLGCSTGNTIINLCKSIKDKNAPFIGVDSSEPVINRAIEKIEGRGLSNRVDLVCSDILDLDLSDAGIVIMNFTLQFIPPHRRLALLKKIYAGLSKGGAFLLSEKVLENNPETSDLFIEKHYDFKREMGYSELEISKKREALEEVLIPFTMEEEFDLLKEAGFKNCSVFFKWFNFASFLAVKD